MGFLFVCLFVCLFGFFGLSSLLTWVPEERDYADTTGFASGLRYYGPVL